MTKQETIQTTNPFITNKKSKQNNPFTKPATGFITEVRTKGRYLCNIKDLHPGTKE